MSVYGTFWCGPKFLTVSGNPKECDRSDGSYGESPFPKPRPHCVTEVRHQCAFPLPVREGARWSTSSSAPGVSRGEDCGHSDGCAVASHDCLNLRSPGVEDEVEQLFIFK